MYALFNFVDLAGGVTSQRVNVTRVVRFDGAQKSPTVLALSRCITVNGWAEDIDIPSLPLSSPPPAPPHLIRFLSSPILSPPSDVGTSRTSRCTSHLILRFLKSISVQQ